jgi:hypothetical protein
MVLKLSNVSCFSLLPSYGWESEGWQDSNVAIIQQNLVLSKRRLSGVDISNGSKVIAFSNVDLHKFKMAAGGQNGGIFQCHLADRFLLSRGIFLSRGMFVALVVSSQCISFHTNIHTDMHPSIA